MSNAGSSPANAKEAGKKAERPDSVVRDISILVVITLAAGLLLGAAYSVTKGPIAQAQAHARATAQQAVMQSAQTFAPLAGESAEDPVIAGIQTALEKKGLTNTLVEQIDEARDQDGRTAGYVVTCSNSEGYGGDVELMCGISAAGDGTLTVEGISFLSLTETAGMGMRAKEESFSGQFQGIRLLPGETLVYTKNGASAENEIDAISGCTITTSAVTKDVNAALEAVRAVTQDS